MATGYVIVQQGGYADRYFELPREGALIGRGDDADLQLSNVSVSRHHARIVLDGRTFGILDLGSGNGTLVNRAPVSAEKPHPLKDEDAIQVGSFKLIFLSQPGRAVPIWRGRFVNQLPPYTATSQQPQEDATFGLDRATLLRMAEADHRQETARIVDNGAAGRSWAPGDRELSFGSRGQIPVSGFLVAATAATVHWSDGYHVISPRSWWTKVAINGSTISEPQRLQNGARVRIGRSLFRYEVPPAPHLQRQRPAAATPATGTSGGRRETVAIPSRKKPTEEPPSSS